MKRIALIVTLAAPGYSSTTTQTHSHLVECSGKSSLWYGCSAAKGSDNLNLFAGHEYESEVSVSYSMTCDPGGNDSSGFVISHRNTREQIFFNSQGSLNYTTQYPIQLSLSSDSMLGFFHYHPGCNFQVSVTTRTPSARVWSQWHTDLENLKLQLTAKGSEQAQLSDNIQLHSDLTHFLPVIDKLLANESVSRELVESSLDLVTCDNSTDFDITCNPLAAIVANPQSDIEQRHAALALLEVLGKIVPAHPECQKEVCPPASLSTLEVSIFNRLKAIASEDKSEDLKAVNATIAELEQKIAAQQNLIDSFK